jgi:hypothetical protein
VDELWYLAVEMQMEALKIAKSGTFSDPHVA